MFSINIPSDPIYKRKFGHETMIYHVLILNWSIDFCKLNFHWREYVHWIMYEKKITPFLGRECKSESWEKINKENEKHIGSFIYVC